MCVVCVNGISDQEDQQSLQPCCKMLCLRENYARSGSKHPLVVYIRAMSPTLVKLVNMNLNI